MITPAPRNTTVFSHHRETIQPEFVVPDLALDVQQKMDGLVLLNKLPANSVPLVFFDPQYRSVLARQSYGNEGKRHKKRMELPQMTNETIHEFIAEIERSLMPSGHLMLWVDKYIVVSGVHSLLEGSTLQPVDMITWNKSRMGMGYRTRRFSEYLIVLQKAPLRAKGVWKSHSIPDVWTEKIDKNDRSHTHAKPIGLQKTLIECVTNIGDIVVDPCAGSYSVMKAALAVERHFIGCDLLE
jgi:site-specific DNA-methyltransferase (adenine-specific)